MIQAYDKTSFCYAEQIMTIPPIMMIAIKYIRDKT